MSALHGPANPRWNGAPESHALYSTWKGMKERCSNPNHIRYAEYGGRGITVCERWRDNFWSFVADVGERPDGHTLDRVDNDRGYEPGNVRWATRSEQNANKRPGVPPTHCVNGHEFTDENTRVNGRGDRACRACDRDRARIYRESRAAS